MKSKAPILTMGMNPKVDFYFNKEKKWQEELAQLRRIVLDCGLAEELKWGVPCYTLDAKNIVLIHVFKEYCALLFFKGALLQDADHILIQQTENTHTTRQVRFTNVQAITESEPVLESYIREAIEVEKSGLKMDLNKNNALEFPEEFQLKLDESPALKTAFESLTPGRQRAYYLHFSAPKLAKTRTSRVEKCLQQIMHGKGLND